MTATVLSPAWDTPPRGGRELGLLAVFFVGWQAVVTATGSWPVAPAIARGRLLWSTERLLHLPSEVAVQSWTAAQHLARLAVGYYDAAHVTVTAAALVVLWRAGVAVYRPCRQLLVTVTLAAFAVQMWQVAPPRMIGRGVVDLAARDGASLYAAAGSHVGQLNAFPSLHVAWALVVAVGLARLGHSWAIAGWTHAALTVAVVVATGNHYWLDVWAAAVLVAVAELVRWSVTERRLRA